MNIELLFVILYNITALHHKKYFFYVSQIILKSNYTILTFSVLGLCPEISFPHFCIHCTIDIELSKVKYHSNTKQLYPTTCFASRLTTILNFFKIVSISWQLH